MTERIRLHAEYVKHNDIYAPPVAVEYDPADESLPDCLRISKRLGEYFAAQTVSLWDGCRFTGQVRFDGSVESDLFQRFGHKGFSDACNRFYCKHQDNLYVMEWQHATADFSYVMRHGIQGYRERIARARELHRGCKEKEEFLDALGEVADVIVAWAHRCGDACLLTAETADAERAAILRKMHDTLYRVPEYPARSFYEALQAIYLCFDMLPDSIGTIDRYLWEFYRNDIEGGVLTREEAKAYLQEFFLRLQSATPFGSGNRKKGGQSHFAIGGYLPNGEDGFTDLSRLIVEALMEIPSHIPQFSLRYTKKTPVEMLHFVMNAERNDPFKRIAIVNDDPRIESFMKNLGMSYEDAVSYTMVGCNEPAFPGNVWMGGITANLARSLTNALSDEKAPACESFDEFYALYEGYLCRDVSLVLAQMEEFNRLRARDVNVLSSLLLDGCIENAESATRGGCRIRVGGPEWMGLVTVIDSLTVIRQFVFEEQVVSMEELIRALSANWEGYGELRTLILKKASFFGNDAPISNEMAQRLTKSLFALCRDRRLEMDVRVLCGNLAGYHAHYAIFGRTTAATPDGRHAGDPFMVGIGQSFGKDREGLTALLSSVAGFDPCGIFCGPTVCNVMLDEATVKNDESFEKLVSVVDTYFKLGGLHIQTNYVSRETLLAARKNPEDFRTLKVRVSGFAGVYTELCEDIQEDILKRTPIAN